MTVLVSMLRGVNVAGYRMLKMTELAKLYASLGFDDVRTYLQSGNVVFTTKEESTPAVAKKIENGLKTRLALEVKVFIRTPKDFEKIIAGNPFIKKEQNRLYLTFLDSKPSTIPVDKLNAARAKGEEFAVSDREVFLFLPYGSGRTKLSNAFFEKMLSVPATTRNWNTVSSLSEMAGGRRD